MVVVSALQKVSIWKHDRAYRRVVQRLSLNITPLHAPFAIASKYCAFGEKRKEADPIYLCILRRKESWNNWQVKKEVGTNLLNEALYLLAQKYTDNVYTKINEAKKVFKSRFVNKIRGKWAFYAKSGGKVKGLIVYILRENSKISSMWTKKKP